MLHQSFRLGHHPNNIHSSRRGHTAPSCSTIFVPRAASEVHPSAQAAPDVPVVDGIEKVPISDLPKPHPKASQTLQKMNQPKATAGYQALVDTLNSVPFTVVCDDQELGWEVAQGVAKRVGWLPVNTSRLLGGIHKLDVPKTGVVPRQKLVDVLGSEQALVDAELDVLKGLRKQRRVIACTLPTGALSQPDSWREVWGTFILWVDEEDPSAPKPKTFERQLLCNRSEVLVRVKKVRGFGGPKTAGDKAKVAVDALMKDLVNYLNANPDIVERKVKYVAFGCRGDWPVVMPHEWSPVVEGLGRQPLDLPEEPQQQ